ncbi:MAG: shikimate dehydrogenase, partial [Bacteroidales bacterium]
LKGYNTDVYGFEKPLLNALKEHHKTALILGTGGASKAVAYILEKHSIGYKYVSRKPVRSGIFSYGDLTPEIIAHYTVIVNTSPAGMYPNDHIKPDIPYEGIGSGHILYDLIYNPQRTLFLKEGESRKAIIINGLSMLHLQAEKAWEIWNRR